MVIAAASGVASTWTVADGDQAGESVITHNLGLSSSNNLVITATADHGIDPGIDEIFCYIENRGINSFQIQMMDGPVAVDGHDVNIICSLVAA